MAFFTLMLFLLLAVILELYKKPKMSKDWVAEKSAEKNLCEGYHFFDCTPTFLCHFLLLSSSTPLLYLLNGPKKDTYCYVWYSVWCRKYEILLQFNTSWCVSKNVILFKTCFSFNCSDYGLTLIIKGHILTCYSFLPSS